MVNNLQKVGLNHITFLFLFLVFFISTAGVIIIPITSVIQRIICLTIHSTPTTIIIIFAQSAGAVEYTDCTPAEG